MDMPLKWKLFWQYILDNCDNAGVWTPNIRLASFQIGEPFEQSEAQRILAGRIEILDDGKWFISKFIEYQYGQLSEACRPHQQVISLLDKHGIKRVSKGYPKGINTLKDKDKDKDKDQEQETEQELPRISPQIEKPKKRTVQEDPMFPRVCALFNRRPTTKWSDKEVSAFKAISPIDQEDMLMIERYYQSERAKGKDGYHRRDLLTFLNNYTGELDRANQACAGLKAAIKRQATERELKGL